MDTGSICRLSGQNEFTHRWEQHNLELGEFDLVECAVGVVQEPRPVRPLAVEGDGQNGIGVGPYYSLPTAKFASTPSIPGPKYIAGATPIARSYNDRCHRVIVADGQKQRPQAKARSKEAPSHK